MVFLDDLKFNFFGSNGMQYYWRKKEECLLTSMCNLLSNLEVEKLWFGDV